MKNIRIIIICVVVLLLALMILLMKGDYQQKNDVHRFAWEYNEQYIPKDATNRIDLEREISDYTKVVARINNQQNELNKISMSSWNPVVKYHIGTTEIVLEIKRTLEIDIKVLDQHLEFAFDHIIADFLEKEGNLNGAEELRKSNSLTISKETKESP